MFELKIIDGFSGAHRLRAYKGKCENLHGHNWKVELAVRGEAGTDGLVMDFGVLKDLLGKVLSNLDHRYLNAIPHFRRHNPTSEQMAKYIFDRMKRLLKGRAVAVRYVTVWENDRQCASYAEE
jgi:6-pyruvoyltetrahydropterin/6-carboxytetrahydropterin synthase